MTSIVTRELDGRNSSDLTRSASYNHIPNINFDSGSDSLRKTLSEINLVLPTSPKTSLQERDDFTTGKEILRQASLRSKRKDGAAFTLGDDEESDTNVTSGKNGRDHGRPGRTRKPNTVSGTLASLARKPWKQSRSPSPLQMNKELKTRTNESVSSEPGPTRSNGASAPAPKVDGKQRPSGPTRSASVLTKRIRRPSGTGSPQEMTEAPSALRRQPSLQSLRRRPSLEKLAASVGLAKKDVPPMPQNFPKNMPKLKTDTPRKRDELWSVFRGLDADYQKYVSGHY